MNEDWERDLKPDSVKAAEELGKREDGIRVTVPIISKKCNWDDALARVATNLFGWIWRGK
jgi:hypothetical protein